MNLIERKVKLFETGDYGSKGKYDTERLESWVKHHNQDGEPIPFNVGHPSEQENPLASLAKKLGMGVKNLYTVATEFGAELWGSLFIPEPMNQMVELTGSKAVSIGLPNDMSRISEVSLVTNPHIKAAQLFKEDFDEVAFVFSADEFYVAEADVTITENQEAITVAEQTENTEQTPEVNAQTPVETKQEFSADERDAMAAEIAKVKAERDEANRLLFAERDEAKVKELEAAGKILPAHKEALLNFSNAGNINFSGETTRVFDAVVRFFESYDVSAVYESTQPATREIENPIDSVEFASDPETDKALARMAKLYGCTVDELKANNLHLAKGAN